MKMIKRKIRLGFFFIGILLFISGIISTGELNRLNNSTSEMLMASKGNVELSKQLLDAVQEQNTLLLLSITDTTHVYDSLVSVSHNDFASAMQKIKKAFKESPSALSSIVKVEKKASAYNRVVNSTEDNRTINWFVDIYGSSYNELTVAIKDFMINNENSLIESAKNVEGDALRASMLGIIALASGFILVVLFYFMIKGFFMTPVLKIEFALKRYLERGIPFSVDIQTKDEIFSLYESITILIDRYKRK